MSDEYNIVINTTVVDSINAVVKEVCEQQDNDTKPILIVTHWDPDQWSDKDKLFVYTKTFVPSNYIFFVRNHAAKPGESFAEPMDAGTRKVMKTMISVVADIAQHNGKHVIGSGQDTTPANGDTKCLEAANMAVVGNIQAGKSSLINTLYKYFGFSRPVAPVPFGSGGRSY